MYSVLWHLRLKWGSYYLISSLHTLGLITYINIKSYKILLDLNKWCVDKYFQIAHSVPSHYLNQCWVSINWTLTNKLQWNLNQNAISLKKLIRKYCMLNGSYFVSASMWYDWTNSQIPECSSSISRNAPFRTEMYTFLFWMEHCVIWNRSIVGFVKLVYWPPLTCPPSLTGSPDTFRVDDCWTHCIRAGLTTTDQWTGLWSTYHTASTLWEMAINFMKWTPSKVAIVCLEAASHMQTQDQCCKYLDRKHTNRST